MPGTKQIKGQLEIWPELDERHPYAAVRKLFEAECEARGYSLQPSLRYTKGKQAWLGTALVGEYNPNSHNAWVTL